MNNYTNSNMENQPSYTTLLVLLIATISGVAYSNNSIYSAYAQPYSDPDEESAGVEGQQPLEGQQQLEGEQPLEEQQPLEGQQPLDESLEKLTENVKINALESIVQAPKEGQKSMPFVLPFDSGRLGE